MKELTLRYRTFVHEYAATGNATKAALKAGYSKKTAYSQGNRLLKKAEIKIALQREADRVIGKAELTADMVIDELRKLAFSNMDDYIERDDKGGAIRVRLADITREQAAAIQEVTIEETIVGAGEAAVPVRKIRFKLADKRAALVDLGRYFGLFGNQDDGGKAPVNIDQINIMANPEDAARLYRELMSQR